MRSRRLQKSSREVHASRDQSCRRSSSASCAITRSAAGGEPFSSQVEGREDSTREDWAVFIRPLYTVKFRPLRWRETGRTHPRTRRENVRFQSAFIVARNAGEPVFSMRADKRRGVRRRIGQQKSTRNSRKRRVHPIAATAKRRNSDQPSRSRV